MTTLSQPLLSSCIILQTFDKLYLIFSLNIDFLFVYSLLLWKFYFYRVANKIQGTKNSKRVEQEEHKKCIKGDVAIGKS